MPSDSSPGFSEATRLAATVAGAARSGSINGIIALTLGVFLNLWARSGWGRFSILWGISKIMVFLPNCVSKRIKPFKLLAPTIFSKLHDEVKVTLGYPRFFVLLALIVSWLIADGLSRATGMEPMHLPRNWDVALIICGVALAFEITEDLIVLGMDSCLQAPITPKAMEYFAGFECEDPFQCLAVVARDYYMAPVEEHSQSLCKLSWHMFTCLTTSSLLASCQLSCQIFTVLLASKLKPKDIYIYIYVCVCVCVDAPKEWRKFRNG